MSEFKLEANSVVRNVTSLQCSNRRIDISIASLGKQSKSCGIMISSYVDKINEISKLLDSYKQLVEKDTVDIIASNAKIIAMDRKMKQLYTNGGGK